MIRLGSHERKYTILLLLLYVIFLSSGSLETIIYRAFDVEYRVKIVTNFSYRQLLTKGNTHGMATKSQ